MNVVLNNRALDVAVKAVPMLRPGVYDPSTALGVTVRPVPGERATLLVPVLHVNS